MKHFLPALRMLAFMTVLTGLAYPLFITGISQTLFTDKARGSFLEKAHTVVGSEWIGQKFESDRYFWPRPSAVDYNPLPSGGSNLGLASQELKKLMEERRSKLKEKNPGSGEPPQDLLFASGSGLDPHISPEAARFQISRICQARNWDITAMHKLVSDLTEPRQFGIFGEPRLNVLRLNLALDELTK